jgi:hypothetical protein
MATTLKDFWEDLSVWSQSTFGKDKLRGPQGPLKHLAKEVQEVLADDHNIEEYADLVFLTFDSCRRAGFTYEQLVEAIEVKLKKNRSRRWGAPSASEPVEHIRGEE